MLASLSRGWSDVMLAQRLLWDQQANNIMSSAGSKLGALEKFGKNLRLFTDKLKVSGEPDIASQLSAARRRARMGRTAAASEDDEDAAA
jgi:hypothetical protein